MKYTPEQVKARIREGKYNFDFEGTKRGNETRRPAEEIQNEIRNKTYQGIDYDHIAEIKRQVAKNNSYSSDKSLTQSAARKAADYNADRTNNNMSYDEKKEYLKQQKSQAKKEKWRATASATLDSILGQITLDEERVQSAKADYDTAHTQYDAAKKALEDLKKNKWNEIQEENSRIIDSNSEVKSLVTQARNAKINADAAQSNIHNSQRFLGSNNISDTLGLQEYGKSYQSSYNEYQTIVDKLNDMGYDAESLIDTYTRQQNKTDTESLSKDVSEFADKHPVLSGGAYVALNSAQSSALPQMITEGVTNAFSDEYVPYDTNTAGFGATNIRDTIAQTNSENVYNYVKEKTDSETAANLSTLAYQTGLSMGDFLSIASLPEPVSLAVMGTSAAVSTAKDATERGISSDKALLTALAAGTAEIVCEKISLENFNALKATGKSGIKNAVKDILKQSFTEGSEEVFTDILNTVSDQIINGDNSALEQQYHQLVESGMTENEALRQVASDFGRQVGESFLGGALSGGVLGSGVSAMNNIKASSDYRAAGEMLKNSGKVQSEIDKGLSAGTQSKAYKAAQALQNSLEQNAYDNHSEEFDYSSLSSRKVGRLADFNAQTESKMLDDGAKVYDGDTAKSYVYAYSDNGYNGNVADYSTGFGAVYMAQQQGKSFDEAYQSALDSGSHITPIQAEIAYNAAKNDSNAISDTKEIVYYSAKENNNSSIKQQIQNHSDELKNMTVVSKVNTSELLLNKKSTVRKQAQSRFENIYNQGGLLSQDGKFIEFTDKLVNGSLNYLKTPAEYAALFSVPEVIKNGKVLDEHREHKNRGYSTFTIMAPVEIDGVRGNMAAVVREVEGRNRYKVHRLLLPDGSNFVFDIKKDTEQGTYRPTSSDENLLTSSVSNNNVSYETSVVNKHSMQKGKVDTKAKSEFEKVLCSKQKSGVTILSKNMTDLQKAETVLIDKFAKNIGKEVIIVDDTEKLGYDASNGMYINNKIVLTTNADGGMMSVYFGHELFHSLKVSSPEQAQALEDFIIEHLKGRPDYDYNARIEDIIEVNKFKGTREQQIAAVNEEIAANACFTTFSEQKNFEELVKQDRTLAQKVRDFFADFIERIEKALEYIRGYKEYNALENEERVKQKILDMFNDCLKESQKNNTTTNGSVRYSFKDIEKIGQVDKENIKYKGNFVIENEIELKSVIEKSLNNSEIKENYYLGNIKSGVKEKITNDLGFNIFKNGDYAFSISSDDIRHIKKHFESVNDIVESIYRLYDVVNNYDTVSIDETEKQKYNKNKLIFNKCYNDFDYRSVEIISKKNRTFDLVSFFVTKNNKKRNKGNGLANTSKLGGLASQTVSVSNNNVSQSETSVNSNDMQDKPKYSLKEDSEGNPLSDEQIKRYKNIAPELKDKKGRIKPFYHGTSRADRVGNYFNPDRATSGPMAYFTDNEKIADNYSKNKSDTSLAYDDEYDSYETQFRVDDKSITEYWYTLSPSEKRELTQKIQQVTLDDDDNIVLKRDNKYGIGNFNNYELNMAKGNALQVLVDGWLNGGTLWGDEYRFIDVLNAIGIKNAEYKNPDYREEKVYKVYLNITNPFNTDNVDEEFISDLEDYVESTDMSIYDTENAQADMWDKNSIDIYDWIERLKDDFDNGTTHAWTSIPDVVTDFLKSYGKYDGIIDRGGKQGGEIHTVAIPFYSNQIKNVDNLNPTENEDIRYSRKESINVDDFDESGYDIINTTGKKGYTHFKSEVMTWDSDKYLDKIRLTRIDDKFYIYKMVNNDSRDIWIYKPKSQQSKNQLKEMREYYAARNYKGSTDAVEIVRNKRRYSNGNNELFGGQREKSRNNDKLNNKEVRGEGNRNRRRTAQNDSDDYLQEERYSIKEQPIDFDAVLEENAELSEMNEDLKRMLAITSSQNEKLKNQFKITDRHNISNNAVDKVAAALRKQYSSTYNKTDLVSRLSGLYDYMANAGADIDSGYIWHNAIGIAKNLIANTQHKDTTFYDEYNELRRYIRNTDIRVPQNVKDNFDDYDDFRKSNFGRLRLSDNGVELDSFYNELAADYPEFFDAGLSESEQLEALANFFEVTSPVYYNTAEQNAESMGLNLEQYANLVAGDIFDKYFEVPELLTAAEKHQKEITEIKTHYRNRISDIRQSYKNRYDERLKEVKEENAKRITKLRKEKTDALANQKAHFEKVSQRGKERREKSKLRASIRKSLNKIVQLGSNPDKKKHIPNSIVDSVKNLAEAIVLDDTKQDAKIAQKLAEFKSGFEHIPDGSQYSVISELYTDYIQEKIIALEEKTGNKPLKQLSVDELKEIDELIKMTVQSINNINKLFIKGRNETIDSYVSKVYEELKPFKKEKMFDGMTKSLMYNSMKPEYFFQYLGSDTLLELYHDLRAGEDTWAVDVSDARKFAVETRKKYGYKNWDFKTVQTFNTSYGDIELTLQERLAVYANSIGEHTKNHLLGGGFVYQKVKSKGIQNLKKKRNDSSNHRLAESDVESIVSSLDDNQRAYVRDMIKYLSDVMGVKGNEVAKVLYGVELFKEKMYYPAKIDKKSRHNSSKDYKAEQKIKNAGFTNSAIKDASQPVELINFDDVWAAHVDEMSKYHAFVLPLENFDRVYNQYQSDNHEYSSVKEMIENAYGDKALAYIDDLISDINGGVVHEAGTKGVNRAISKFKKGAVFASASVAIQQPSAIARALSEVDAKYFVKVTGSGFSRKAYEEMKQYAPVAIIKEMGYFDTNMAQSTVDFLNNNDYEGIKEKVKAFVKDGSYRDDALSFFASKADEITWTHIWNACKAEVRAKNSGLAKEEILEKTGERFTEVITKTQVYDSVFSRSGLMRSRDNIVKSATAFMAEPTTSLNMLANAVVQAKRGNISKAQGARVFGSLIAASAMNSFLQSVVTAARADDDDKDWKEVYLAQLIPNFIDNLNPLNQIAFLKDIFNIFQGYDVTRADMNLISDLYDAIDKLNSDKISTSEKMKKLAGAVAAFFGWPVKNVIRDIESAFNVINDFRDDKKYSSESALDLFKEEMNSVLGFELFNSDLDVALKAVEKNDMETYQEYADKIYATDDAYDLLYGVLKKYGYNSSQYAAAKEKCINVKKNNGAKNPNPDNSMKGKALKEYAKLKENGTYEQAEKARQLCIQLYGDMTKVDEALKKLND